MLLAATTQLCNCMSRVAAQPVNPATARSTRPREQQIRALRQKEARPGKKTGFQLVRVWAFALRAFASKANTRDAGRRAELN